MAKENLQSFRETAKELGVHRAVISGMVDALGIETKPIPTNGKARGLNREAIRRIKERLRPEGKR